MTARPTLLTNDPQTPYDQQLLTAMLADPRTWGEASHVLPKLLTRDDLAPPVLSAISKIARVWLTDNPTAPHASFVISPLLGRDDLTPDDAVDTIRLALEWLARLLPGPHTADTGRVLCALLRRRDTPMAELLPTLERWISHHGLCPDAAPVYKSVFTGKSIPPSAPVRAVEWLETASEEVVQVAGLQRAEV